MKDSCMCVCMYVRMRTSLSVSDCVNSQRVSIHHSTKFIHTFTHYRGYACWYFAVCAHRGRKSWRRPSAEFSAATTLVYLRTSFRFVSPPSAQDHFISFTFPSYLLLKHSYCKYSVPTYNHSHTFTVIHTISKEMMGETSRKKTTKLSSIFRVIRLTFIAIVRRLKKAWKLCHYSVGCPRPWPCERKYLLSSPVISSHCLIQQEDLLQKQIK
jgi:hypothetical protein